jgi:cell division protein FtsI (penicillin-binding protein 3)
MTNLKRSIMWRVMVAMLFVVLFAVFISVQMFRIQWVEGEYWLSQSDSLTIIKQDISPARGNIYAADGSLLATSMPIYDIRWDATVVDQDSFARWVDELAINLSVLFPENTASYYRSMLRNARAKGNRYKLIRRRATYSEQLQMRSFPIFRMGRFKGGFIAELTTKRVKPAGMLASRTIGYYNEETKGVGLERTYNEYLGGSSGKRLVQKISGGYRPINDENLLEPQNGRDVHTTINVDFQEIAQRSLSASLDMHKAKHGCVVILETATGKIRAISNLQNKGEGNLVEAYNYAIGESYEPGSVWKVFSTVALLEDGIVKPQDTVDIRMGYREFFGKPMRDSDEGRYRKVSFSDALARSSNVAFSSLVFDNYNSNPGKYISHMRKLELDRPTGIGILGEPEPFLNHPETDRWSNLTLPWLAIGYENQHTPLQIIAAYNGVVNNGMLVKPRLVERVTEAGVIVESYENEKAVQVCSKKTSEQIREMTAKVFEYGTASGSKSSVVPLAGKTGTAQIATGGAYQKQRKYNTTIVGHFPADKPVYTMLVMINEPSNGQVYSSQTCVPVFKEIAEKVYTISVKQDVEKAEKPLLPNLKTGYFADVKTINTQLQFPMNEQAVSDIVSYKQGKVKGLKYKDGTMPDVRGMGAKDAIYLLEQKGLKTRIRGVGKVKEQSPQPGRKVNRGRTVYVRLG